MMKEVTAVKGDFHIHTYYSDGVFSPEKIVDLATEAGLEVIALTDHDNILSYGVAQEYINSKNLSLKLIPGIEVNTLYKDYEVHILGYFPDVTKPDFKAMLKAQQQARVKQTKEILRLMAKKEGIRINYGHKDTVFASIKKDNSLPVLKQRAVSKGGPPGSCPAGPRSVKTGRSAPNRFRARISARLSCCRSGG